MTDATVDELKVFASYRSRWSIGRKAQGAGKVLALAGTCRTPDEIISMLRLDEPGDARDAAIGFVHLFRCLSVMNTLIPS